MFKWWIRSLALSLGLTLTAVHARDPGSSAPPSNPRAIAVSQPDSRQFSSFSQPSSPTYPTHGFVRPVAVATSQAKPATKSTANVSSKPVVRGAAADSGAESQSYRDPGSRGLHTWRPAESSLTPVSAIRTTAENPVLPVPYNTPTPAPTAPVATTGVPLPPPTDLATPPLPPAGVLPPVGNLPPQPAPLTGGTMPLPPTGGLMTPPVISSGLPPVGSPYSAVPNPAGENYPPPYPPAAYGPPSNPGVAPAPNGGPTYAPPTAPMPSYAPPSRPMPPAAGGIPPIPNTMAGMQGPPPQPHLRPTPQPQPQRPSYFPRSMFGNRPAPRQPVAPPGYVHQVPAPVASHGVPHVQHPIHPATPSPCEQGECRQGATNVPCPTCSTCPTCAPTPIATTVPTATPAYIAPTAPAFAAFGCSPCCDAANLVLGAEYLLWWMNGDRTPPLVTTGIAGNLDSIRLGDPNSTIVLGDSKLGGGRALTGVRLYGQYWFGDEHLWGVEARGFSLFEDNLKFNLGSDGSLPIGRPIIDRATPVFINGVVVNPNPNFGNGDAQIVAFGDVAGSVSVQRRTLLWGYEANIRRNICCGEGATFDLFAGYRQMGLDESLEIREDINDPQQGNIRVRDYFGTQNRFYGGQLGAEALWFWGNFSLGLRSSVALGCTQQRLVVDGSTIFTPLGQNVSLVGSGGLLALNGTNIGVTRSKAFGVIPEVGMTLGYNVRDWLRLTAGYNFLYWNNVIRPGNQVDLNVNRNFQPFAPAAVFQQGPAQPAPQFRTTDFFAHGLTFGVEFRY